MKSIASLRSIWVLVELHKTLRKLLFFRKAFVAMTARRVQPETLSTFLRCQSRREVLLHSQIHSLCILQTVEALLSKQAALGAEVGGY